MAKWNPEDYTVDSDIRTRINESGDVELIEFAAKLSDEQLERLSELVRSGIL